MRAFITSTSAVVLLIALLSPTPAPALAQGEGQPSRSKDRPRTKEKPPRLPLAGTWKVTVLDAGQEITVWLLRIDNDVKKAEVLWGLNNATADFQTSKPTLVRAETDLLRCNLRTGSTDYVLTARPPLGKAAYDQFLGSLRIGTHFVPVRLERTELTRFERDKAVKPMDGASELQLATKVPELGDRHKAIQGLVKGSAGKPITFVACQVGLSDLMRSRVEADAFKPYLAPFVREGALYGREMQLATRLVLARSLVGYKETLELALEQARAAVNSISKDDPPLVELHAYTLLCTALQRSEKEDDIKAFLPKLRSVIAACLKAAPAADAPQEQRAVRREVATVLLGSPSAAVADLGLEQARLASESLKDTDPLAERMSTRRLLWAALVHRGKKDEAGKAAQEVEKLEQETDQEYARAAVPFRVLPVKRKGKGERAVLVETVTNSQVRVCAATDVAFDALRQTYQPSDVILLSYHRSSVAQDPLAVPATQARVAFYGEAHAGPVPSVLIDGKSTEAMGGHRPTARARYNTLRERIDKALDAPAEAKIKLAATRKDGVITAEVEVSDLAKTGDNIRLYLLLTEKTIRYPGGNGQRLHHNVVRSFIGPEDGIKLTEKTSSHKQALKSAELRKKLQDYLTGLLEKGPFPGELPVSRAGLRVVAVVQDSSTLKVLQAAQVDVQEAQ